MGLFTTCTWGPLYMVLRGLSCEVILDSDLYDGISSLKLYRLILCDVSLLLLEIGVSFTHWKCYNPFCSVLS